MLVDSQICCVGIAVKPRKCPGVAGGELLMTLMRYCVGRGFAGWYVSGDVVLVMREERRCLQFMAALGLSVIREQYSASDHISCVRGIDRTHYAIPGGVRPPISAQPYQ
ncbi:hypothetical protein KCP70_19280 [Salmonella enterica subsp. enterica]|nr:hypothetical protein KCP70_19280 [Salmonella enterica subsp. enterica]